MDVVDVWLFGAVWIDVGVLVVCLFAWLRVFVCFLVVACLSVLFG